MCMGAWQGIDIERRAECNKAQLLATAGAIPRLDLRHHPSSPGHFRHTDVPSAAGITQQQRLTTRVPSRMRVALVVVHAAAAALALLRHRARPDADRLAPGAFAVSV